MYIPCTGYLLFIDYVRTHICTIGPTCIYVCMLVYMYACMSIMYKCQLMSGCMYICVYACMRVCYACMFACSHYQCMYVCNNVILLRKRSSTIFFHHEL